MSQPKLCQICIDVKPHLADQKCPFCGKLRCSRVSLCNCLRVTEAKETLNQTYVLLSALTKGICQIENIHKNEVFVCPACGISCCDLCSDLFFPEKPQEIIGFLEAMATKGSYYARLMKFSPVISSAYISIRQLIEKMEQTVKEGYGFAICERCFPNFIAHRPALVSPSVDEESVLEGYLGLSEENDSNQESKSFLPNFFGVDFEHHQGLSEGEDLVEEITGGVHDRINQILVASRQQKAVNRQIAQEEEYRKILLAKPDRLPPPRKIQLQIEAGKKLNAKSEKRKDSGEINLINFNIELSGLLALLFFIGSFVFAVWAVFVYS